jgi:FRG domain
VTVFAYESLREHLGSDDALTLDDVRSRRLTRAAWCSRLIGAMAWLSAQSNYEYVWRGHTCDEWPLQPRLSRYVAVHRGGSAVRDVLIEEKAVLGEALHERLDIRDGQPLNLLMTAAWLQHHAVPTRLLDVTRDPLVAAFFASQPDTTPDNDGAVIAIRVPRWHRVRFDPSLSGSLHEGLRFFNVRKRPETPPYSRALWNPPNLDSRIPAQRSSFLVPNLHPKAARPTEYGVSPKFYAPTRPIGLGIANTHGPEDDTLREITHSYLKGDSPNGSRTGHYINVGMFVIPGERKSQLQEYLRALGVSVRTVFPDVDGFAKSFPPC